MALADCVVIATKASAEQSYRREYSRITNHNVFLSILREALNKLGFSANDVKYMTYDLQD